MSVCMNCSGNGAYESGDIRRLCPICREKVMEEDIEGDYVEYNDHATLKAELEQLKKEREWRPIETAPSSQNTSNRFLAYVPGHGITICWKNHSGYIWSVYTDNSVTKATHWQPLPKPPKNLSEEALNELTEVSQELGLYNDTIRDKDNE